MSCSHILDDSIVWLTSAPSEKISTILLASVVLSPLSGQRFKNAAMSIMAKLLLAKMFTSCVAFSRTPRRLPGRY